MEDILPDYKIYGQKPNDYIDEYLDIKSNWDNLPFYISEYIKNKK